MIHPAVKTYEVCQKTRTARYRHTVEINGERLQAEATVSLRMEAFGGPTVADTDEDLKRQLLRAIRNMIYKD